MSAATALSFSFGLLGKNNFAYTQGMTCIGAAMMALALLSLVMGVFLMGCWPMDNQMLLEILRTPPKLWIDDPVEVMQRHAAYNRAANELERHQKTNETSCKWEQQDEFDCSGTYETGCGNLFHLENGTPEENNFGFCCYCGMKLVQVLIDFECHNSER